MIFMIPKATAPARAARIVTMCNRYAWFVMGELMARVAAACQARG